MDIEQVLQKIIEEIKQNIGWDNMEFYTSIDENNELEWGVRQEHSHGFNEVTLYTLPLSRWYWIDSRELSDYEVNKIRTILMEAKEQE